MEHMLQAMEAVDGEIHGINRQCVVEECKPVVETGPWDVRDLLKLGVHSRQVHASSKDFVAWEKQFTTERSFG